MNSPNLQQRIYLAKALNENTDTLFDHPEMNEAVTRKHFQQVADLIKAHSDAKKRAELAAHHAEIFKKQNPRFDHERFFKAANAEKPMNEEEMGEESITEGAKRKARLLRAMTGGKNFGDLEIAKKRATAYDSELGRRVARKRRKGGAPKRTIAKFFNKDTKTSPAVDKAIARFNEKELAIQQKLRAMGKNISEGMDLDEGSYIHSKGQLKKSIKGSKREIVKAMKKGNKKEASFWMQNKKDAEEQLKEASASVPAWRKEDWVFDLPNSTVRELKAKHGKHLAQINAGSAAPKGLRKSIHTILQKHQIPNLMANPRHSIDAVMSSFHTYHSDPQISANDIYTSRRAARAAGKALKEATQLDEISFVKKALVKVRKSMRGDGVVGTAALAASNVAPKLWGGVSDADNEHRRKYGAKMRLRRKALKEGSLGKKRVKRVFKSKRDDREFRNSAMAKVLNLTTRKVLRAGADPRDVATRMKDSSANLRTLNALQRFNDEARLKSKYPALRKK